MQEKINTNAWIEINLNHLTHNVRSIQTKLPSKCTFMAVVKANAYGHGDILISKHLNKIGINSFGVATLQEGIRLRENGIKGEILIFGYTQSCYAKQLQYYQLTQTVIDFDHARELFETKIPLKVHLKIDTGMHRVGFNHENIEELVRIVEFETFNIDGMYTHLSVCDSKSEKDINFTNKQIQKFYQAVEKLEKCGIKIPNLHIQSSYGALNASNLQCDYARIGIVMYGVHSSLKDHRQQTIKLRPVLSLKAKIGMIREATIGEYVGYGCAYQVEKKTKIAVIPVGYADGIPRNLSGKAHVLIRGYQAPIIGRICMDQCMVDVTHIPEVRKGDIATLIGVDGSQEITIEQLAQEGETISNEIVSRLGTRIPRVSSEVISKENIGTQISQLDLNLKK